MIIQDFLKNSSQEVVVFKYLEMLAERTVQLEQRLELNELQQLKQENQQLRQQLAKIKSPPIEQLLVFLPAFFKNFWSYVSPNELALLADTLKVPELPSVITSPDNATVIAMRDRFLQLPKQDQEQIGIFALQLQKSHQLKWHLLAPVINVVSDI
ncbi:MAG TPA: hypothetical protein PKC44_12150 [Agitococcus sp.]|nr:hypothetical protein [Agitococcus sp.]